jgi:hypothetical protein
MNNRNFSTKVFLAIVSAGWLAAPFAQPAGSAEPVPAASASPGGDHAPKTQDSGPAGPARAPQTTQTEQPGNQAIMDVLCRKSFKGYCDFKEPPKK